MGNAVLVFSHELGHWLTAKKLGLKINDKIKLSFNDKICQGAGYLDKNIYTIDLKTLTEEDRSKLIVVYLAGPTSDYIILRNAIGEEAAKKYLFENESYWHNLEDRKNNKDFSIVKECAGDLYCASLLEPALKDQNTLLECIDQVKNILIEDEGPWELGCEKFIEMIRNENFLEIFKNQEVEINIPILLKQVGFYVDNGVG